jgi:ABC-type nitrate/sulfonate/bicarbonate transport system permease component
MTFQYIAQHLLLSLVPWLIGSTLGCVIGYGIALLIKKFFIGFPGRRGLKVFTPWRTIIMVSLLLVYSPLIVVWVGLGSTATLLIVGFFVFLLALPITTGILIEKWCPSSIAVRLAAAVRTLATSSIVLTVTTGIYSTGGLGPIMIEQLDMLEYSSVFSTLLIVAAITLMVDMLLGIPHFFLVRSKEKESLIRPVYQ